MWPHGMIRILVHVRSFHVIVIVLLRLLGSISFPVTVRYKPELEDCAGEVGLGEVGPAESGTVTVEGGTAEVCAAKVGGRENGSGEVCFGEVGAIMID